MDPERWQQVQDLFDRALLLPEPEWADFLRGETGGDTDLQAEVETLLTAETESAGFIDDALVEGLDLFFEDDSTRVEPSAFGKYEILEKIGQGGFGQVYRGRDPRLERAVAIKTCSAKDPALRQRFFREARISAGLQHPKIVTIHDFGEEGDLPYLVQELLDGEDLDQLIERREEIPLAVELSYLLQIAQGLSYAHGEKVLHRDIKPQNVRVLPGDQIKILDFGIACLVNEQQRLTRENTTVGTIGYIAPEQLRGEPLDERSDIFSFGVLAYELLALERPFQGRVFADISYKILHREPRSLSELRPDLPEVLRVLVHRCLEKEPEDRFRSFGQIVENLAEIAGVSGSAVKSPRRRPPFGTMAAFAVMAGLTLFAVRIDWLRSRQVEVAETSTSPMATVEPPQITTEPTGKQEVPESAQDLVGESAATRDLDAASTDRPTSIPATNSGKLSATTSEDAASIHTDSIAEDPSRAPVDEGSLQPSPSAEPHDGADAGSNSLDKRFDAAASQAEALPPTDEASSRPLAQEPGGGSPSPEGEKTPVQVPAGSPSEASTVQLSTRPLEGSPEPVVVHREEPRYPSLARRRGKEAEVNVAVLVDASGLVQRTLITYCSEPDLGFEEAAQEAARKATFRPAELGGKSVQAWTELSYEFRLK